MKQKMFLTSAIAMGVVAPAFAAPTYTSDTFPTNGLMQQDYTYTNAATADNMDDVYEGTVNAVAEYDTVDYILSAGQYLPADSENPAPCLAGSFCSGIGEVQYNETSAQGIETCPTGFGSSAAGSSSNTQCYRTCDIDNVGDSITAIAHATAISGNDYYGSGIDTCVPTACENGWHIHAGINLTSLIGEDKASSYGYISHDGENTNNETTYGITNNGDFVVDYGSKGKLSGHSQCSTRSATDPWVGPSSTYVLQSDGTTETLTGTTGQYCYCHLDSYTPSNGSAVALDAPWLFFFDNIVYGDCASNCASDCAYNLLNNTQSSLAFRSAMFGLVDDSPASCVANTITINWSNADAEDISANNAGTATYGSDVRTPVKANTYKGKTFKGWRFSKPEQTQLP